ncbi:MAG: hypothetical protein FJX77_17745 [Armatimonadetes bacterium]|nr:hypothetical protein [Armatimonadota bacterium]
MNVKRSWVVMAAMALLVSVASGASAQGRRGGPPPAEALFGRFDTNKDGALTENEVPPPMWRRLRSADANGDGAVTIAELPGGRPGGPPWLRSRSEP